MSQMVRVKVLQRYFDRKIGDYLEEKHEFEVDKKRAELLVREGVAEIIKQTPKTTEKKK